MEEEEAEYGNQIWIVVKRKSEKGGVKGMQCLWNQKRDERESGGE